MIERYVSQLVSGTEVHPTGFELMSSDGGVYLTGRVLSSSVKVLYAVVLADPGLACNDETVQELRRKFQQLGMRFIHDGEGSITNLPRTQQVRGWVIGGEVS